MKITESLTLKTLFYWFLSLLVLELSQSVVKFFNPYYFNIVRMGIYATLLLLMGLKVRAKKGLLIPVYIIAMVLIVLQYFVVWN